MHSGTIGTVRLASSFFCQSPRIDGSAARLGKVEIASIVKVRRRAFKDDFKADTPGLMTTKTRADPGAFAPKYVHFANAPG
jgi:hypothetical protein